MTDQLSSIRRAFDQRLMALDAGLADPDNCPSLEVLVRDLARASGDEADAAARGAVLRAQREANSTTAVAIADAAQAHVLLDTERATSASLRTDVARLKEHLSTAITARHDADAERQREIAGLTATIAQFQQSLDEAQRAATQNADVLASAATRADTAIHDRDALIAERDSLLTERQSLHAERDNLLAARDSLQTERDNLLAARDSLQTERDNLLAARDSLRAERHSLRAAHDGLLAERDRLLTERTGLRVERDSLLGERDGLLVERKTLVSAHADVMRAATSQARGLASAAELADTAMRDHEALLVERDRLLAECERFASERADFVRAHDALVLQRDTLAHERDDILRERDREVTRAREERAVAQAPVRETIPPAAAPRHVAPRPVANGPVRQADRQAFNNALGVQIDGEAALLVDLSVAGAQVLSCSSLKPAKTVKMLLPSSEMPVLCRGKIVWARLEPTTPGKPIRYRAGMFFTATDQAAVQTFITRHGARSLS